ncbi:MAG: hypothetical protein LBR94_05495 [Desulfovibrio sp.]|jgi:hypothetical protein|nr:hypothetical protein [Desulfovibrio sp.]
MDYRTESVEDFFVDFSLDFSDALPMLRQIVRRQPLQAVACQAEPRQGASTMPAKASAAKAAHVPRATMLTLPTIVPKTPGNTAPLSTHLARTPLFSVRHRGERAMVNDYQLPSPQGSAVFYTGVELDMGDQDVYLMALHLAANCAPDTPIQINRADFLTKIGRKSKGKAMYDWLSESFSRIGKGTILIQTPEYDLRMPLLGPLLHHKESGQYSFCIPKSTMGIFLNSFYGYINLDIRNSISKNVDLTKWVLGYASSHVAGPHVVRVENLKTWCGYGGPVHKYRHILTDALDELVRLDFLENWKISIDKVTVRWRRERYVDKPRPLPSAVLTHMLPLSLPQTQGQSKDA